MRTSLRHVVPAVSVLAAASAAVADADSNLKYGAWTSEGLPPFPQVSPMQAPDESIEFVVNDGVGGWAYLTCSAEMLGDPATEQDEGALPVGNGHALVCSTFEQPVTLVETLLSEDGKVYCLQAQAAEYRVVSDARLDVTVTKISPDGPWTVRATSPTAWTVQKVQSNLGSIWPLWLEINYEAIALAPARNNSCLGPQSSTR